MRDDFIISETITLFVKLQIVSWLQHVKKNYPHNRFIKNPVKQKITINFSTVVFYMVEKYFELSCYDLKLVGTNNK